MPNRLCVFPFEYKGVRYNECITVNNDSPWCSVEVDGSGKTFPDNWGNCAPGCPGAQTGMAQNKHKYKYIYKTYIVNFINGHGMKVVHCIVFLRYLIRVCAQGTLWYRQ